MGKIPRLVLWLCKKFTRQELQELVHELEEILAGRQPEPQPRDDFRQQHPHYRDFYVDPLAHEVLRRAQVEPLLTYQNEQQSYLSVLRDHDYYVLRAIFRPPAALLTPTGAAPVAPTGTVSLREVRKQIAEILKARAPLTADMVGQIDVAGKPLPEVIADLKHLTFLENVWLPYAAMTQVEQAARALVTAAQQLKQSREFQEGVEEAINSTKEALARNVREYRWVSSLWTKLDVAVEALSSGIRTGGVDRFDPSLHADRIDVSKDLGLIRFGLSNDVRERVQAVFEALMLGGEAAKSACVSVVTSCYRGRGEPTSESENLLIAISILWILKLDREIIDLMAGIETDLHYSVALIFAAATFRSRRERARGERTLRQLEARYRNAKDPHERASLAIGIAYLFFHLWKCLGFVATWGQTDETAGLASARESAELIDSALTYAKEAAALLNVNDPKRVYALNQYLYYLVEACDDRRRPEMTEAANKLLEYKRAPDVWQYRFDDTLGRYFHRLALSIKNRDRRTELLAASKRHLDDALQHAYGDEEVITHHSQLEIALAS